MNILVIFPTSNIILLCSCGEKQDWDRQSPTQIVTEMCGFVTILSGTFLLHRTKDMTDGMIFVFFFLAVVLPNLKTFLFSQK